MEDFIAALKAAYPEVIFFSPSDKQSGDYSVYSNPYAWWEIREQHIWYIKFRVPDAEDLADGRPEVLSGGVRGLLAEWTKEGFQKAGKWGHLNFAGLCRFEEAIIPALESYEYKLRKVHAEQLTDIRVFNTKYTACISFCYDINDPGIVTFVKHVKQMWDSISVKTVAEYDLVTRAIVETTTLGWGAYSKRIFDACALADDLFVEPRYSPNEQRYFATGPTGNYRKKVRKRFGLS